MTTSAFKAMLTGGHPNSLGRTVEVVDLVLADPMLLEELYRCYTSDDAVVRLRVSSAMKRIGRERPEWLVPYFDLFLMEVSRIDQASAQWTLAQLFLELEDRLTPAQKAAAIVVLRTNLERSNDWIVQNHTMATLAHWAVTDKELAAWLVPQLERLSRSHLKSVAARARKLLARLRTTADAPAVIEP